MFPPVPGGQSHLFTTIEQVRQYAVAHNDTFGELGFGGPDNGFVIASFVGDLTIHARALALLVDVPRGVIVCPAKFVGATMLALRNEILAQGVATQVDEFNGRAIVRIPADRRTAADALIAKYGHRILVMLGEFAYPDMNAETGLVPFPPCGELPVPSPRTKQLRWSTRPRSLQINSGGSLSADLTFTNVGYAPFSYNVDTTVGAVVAALGSNKIVARPLLYSILMATAGTLRQGQSSHVRGGATTASCDSRLGWALAPGRYELHFLLQHFSRAAGAETFMSTPIPLTIANGPPPPVRAHPDQSQITLPGIAP